MLQKIFNLTLIVLLLICSNGFCSFDNDIKIEQVHIKLDNSKEQNQQGQLKGLLIEHTIDLLNNTYEEEQFLNKILDDNTKDVPDELDWRDFENRVTIVREQGYCHASWAFAAVGVLEGQEVNVERSLKKIVQLSEQNLIDCTETNNGCKGGSVKEALLKVAKQNGIDSLRSYPYDGSKYKCRYNKQTSILSKINGAAVLRSNDEVKLKQVVAGYGPVAVHFDASDNFSYYESGVYKGSGKCSQSVDKLDTALLIVGYGVDDQEGDFWIVKNSVSDFWGYAGFGLIARGNNTCGIATLPVIATY